MATKPSIARWHDRLGHPSMGVISRVVKENKLPCSSLEYNKESVCDACQQGKNHQLSFSKSISVSQAPLELVHLDVWGPTPTFIGRKNYYVSFIDDFSKHTWICLIRHKSEVFRVFHTFQSFVERTFNRKILSTQTDWGGEYQKLNMFFTCIGIKHQVSCPHTHQQNGVVECKHQHIVEVGLSLLAHAHMPLKY
jgi:transposase InsO family protein